MAGIVGIDPGATGGIFWVANDRSQTELTKSSSDNSEAANSIYDIVTRRLPNIVIVEKVSSFPGQGSVSTFTFGTRFGLVQGVLYALKVPFLLVTPKKWQKELEVTISKESIDVTDPKKIRYQRKKLQKNKAHACAKALYPNIEIPIELADAILLAEYGLRRIRSL